MITLLLLLAQIPTLPPVPQPPSMTPQVAPQAADAGGSQPPNAGGSQPVIAGASLAADAGAPASPPLVPAAAAFEGLTPAALQRIQAALQRQKLDGWLLYDFRGSDPIAYRLLGVDSEHGVHTRRWYCYLPAHGQPQKLLHAIEPHALEGVPGAVATYSSWRARDQKLGALLRGQRRIAMQYSPRNDIPYVAKVDAGTLELVRSLGPEIVSSADLVAEVASTLSPEELASQARSTELIASVEEATAQEAAQRLRDGRPASERELQEFAAARLRAGGVTENDRPGVAVDAHSADPHYSPADTGSLPAARGSVLLIDIGARIGSGPHDIYGDLTRVYFLGERTPDEVARVAAVVFAARDAAIAFLRQRVEVGKPPTGAEVDDVARAVIDKAGYGANFIHRTGHNIGVRGHGDGVNNDNFETHDTRRHLQSTCFSIEPGIYLPGRFGIRTEVDGCILPGNRFEVRGGLQTEVPAILK